MTAPVFTEVTEDGIAILTLNRAPVNALVPTFLADIAETLNTLAADKHVHAVVLTSALKVLSGGFDLKAAQAFTSELEKTLYGTAQSRARSTAIQDIASSIFAPATVVPAQTKPWVYVSTAAGCTCGLLSDNSAQCFGDGKVSTPYTTAADSAKFCALPNREQVAGLVGKSVAALVKTGLWPTMWRDISVGQEHVCG